MISMSKILDSNDWFEAIRTSDKNKIRKMLDADLDINTRENPFGHTALHITALKDDHHIALLLVENGADISLKTISGLSLLHLIYSANAIETLNALETKIDTTPFYLDRKMRNQPPNDVSNKLDKDRARRISQFNESLRRSAESARAKGAIIIDF